LFSNLVILVEGNTEEILLPSIFLSKFGRIMSDFGINVINVGGYNSYTPYLKVLHDFDIQYIIWTDCDNPQIKNAVEKQVNYVFSNTNDLIFLPDNTYTEYYLNQNGYNSYYLDSYFGTNNNFNQNKIQTALTVRDSILGSVYISNPKLEELFTNIQKKVGVI
jgi:putative ATP-dependent endonuclease of OLD family